MTLLRTALYTIAAEAIVFSCFRRFRRPLFLGASVLVNFVTNVSLNLALRVFCPQATLLSWQVIAGEAIVWILEYMAYWTMFGNSRELPLAVCLANALSFSLSFFL